MLAGDFKDGAIGAGHDGGAPAFGKARNIRHLVGHGDGLGVVDGGGWRNHRHRSCPFWAAPADNPITLLAAACKNCFDSCSSLRARERTIAPTIVERIAMALPPGSLPSASSTQRPSISRYSLIPASNDAFTSAPCLAASEPSAATGQPSIRSSRCSVLR